MSKRPVMPVTGKQAGFGLIEFMIAGVLGLFVIAGIIQVFVMSGQTGRLQEAVTDSQEAVRFVELAIRDNLLQAGWAGTGGGDWTLETHIDFTAGTVNNDATGNDSLRITYASATDCSGVATAGTAVNTYSVVAGNLQCNGIVLLENVESLQFLYGVDDDQDGSANRYVTAATVVAEDISAWVASVRMGMLVRSEQEVLDSAQSQTFKVLNEQPVTVNDRNLRRLYTSTIALRNLPMFTVGGS